MLYILTGDRCWVLASVLLLVSLPACAAEPEEVYYSQGSLARARDACKDVKFESQKIAMVFGPQDAQNRNIETVVVKVHCDGNGKVEKLVVRVVIAGANPPVPNSHDEIPPPMSDFSKLVERLLLGKK